MGWPDELRAAGFDVAIEQAYSLPRPAGRVEVPEALRACQSATMGDHVIEGAVPAVDIGRLLAFTTPVALAPRGGVAMAIEGDDRGPRDTVLIEADGTLRVFAHHH